MTTEEQTELLSTLRRLPARGGGYLPDGTEVKEMDLGDSLRCTLITYANGQVCIDTNVSLDNLLTLARLLLRILTLHATRHPNAGQVELTQYAYAQATCNNQ